MIKTLQGITPQIGAGTFVAETAAVIGDVVIGSGCSIWYGAVLRGDVNKIRLGDRVSVQDGCCLHTSAGEAYISIGSRVTIGHNATLHGCKIGDHVLIGMGATVLDNAVVSSDSVVAAGALVLERTVIPSGELWGGVPARCLKKLSPEQVAAIMDLGLAAYDHWTEVYNAER